MGSHNNQIRKIIVKRLSFRNGVTEALTEKSSNKEATVLLTHHQTLKLR